MRDIFEQLNMKQIILVSHEQKIEGFVDHVIRIKKDKTSMIEKV
jgi:DNA repair protein SbcC/Rad50